VFEIGIAVGSDPLQEEAGENGGVKPGDEKQEHHALPEGQTGGQASLLGGEEWDHLCRFTHRGALRTENMRKWALTQSKTGNEVATSGYRER
jgi:hypothetical protein